jgi:hypothetical protein
LPLAGTSAATADDGNIGWGDFFLNPTGLSFQAASQAQALIGIRFAGTNDSGASQVGVYGDVTATSVTSDNSGFSTLTDYYQAGWFQSPTMGDPTTLEAVEHYFGTETPVLNAIGTGNYLGALTFLDDQAADAAGLDLQHVGVNAPTTITFSFEAALVPSTPLIASLFVECANDGVALVKPAAKTVPEPSVLWGLGILWLGHRLGLRQSVC